ncbi:deoxynucleoside triphosphate triphosphohydrolase SAMHD1-like isoform X1 [Mytilus galloprovincialis]|uniref:deoxynucleoside triphosphate triphosphohydrolase SAMHD1-like isoform X1 n=1 Tax=Mytilus galloprovincialis TaxID=29158 RepID=UPI003F7B652C
MSKILNDPIHGTIELDPLLIRIIDTPQFQRLRNIKQLGGCYFVYPSASHNRFEHSIGTCFLAGRLACQLQKRLDQIIEKLGENDDIEKLGEDDDIEKLREDDDIEKLGEDDDIEKLGEDNEKKMYVEKLKKAEMTDDDKLCIEIAGLCHDIGHGPYSHLFDRLFMKAMKEKDPSMEEWKHEDVSRMMIDYMIDENKELAEAFEKRFTDWKEKKEFIKDLIDGTKNKKENKAKNYMYEIVANKRNEIDVDKMDYFARDCHGLGMKSNFDHLRYISQCRVMFSSDKSEETTIAVRDKEEHNLYELFHTRIGLFRRAYYHKVTKAVELMLTDALVKANEHLVFTTHKGEKIKMSTAWKHLDVYEELTDNIFERILIKNNEKEDMKKAQELIKNVYKRKLYKLVDETSPIKEIEGKHDILRDHLLTTTDLNKDDFAVQKVTYSYGKKLENPITSVYFYRKDNYMECFQGTRSTMTSLFLPETFQEEILRVYSKNDEKIDTLKKETTEWLKQNGLSSVNDPAIKQEQRGSAEDGSKTKHKSSIEGMPGPSKRPK